jgi:alpha-beta hydrolase superfamily lysophospholipase
MGIDLRHFGPQEIRHLINLMFTTFLILLSIPLLFPMVLHWVYRAPRTVARSTPVEHGLPYTQHTIDSVNGKRLIAWRIPAQESSCTLVVVHGWGANMEMMLPLAQPFHQAGMNVLLYDARNHGKSDGDSFSSLPRFAQDLDRVLQWLRRNNPDDQVVVLGHSIGAAATILAASHYAQIDLVIGLSSFAHPNLVMNRHLDRPWLPCFIRLLIIHYIQWVIGYRFDEIAPMNRIPYVRCPILLAHGTDDRVVPIDDMHLIASNATTQGQVQVVTVEGARHDSVEHVQQYADILIQFIRGNLPAI